MGKKMIIDAGLGFGTEGFAEKGYILEKPYLDRTLIGRVIREIWFRIGLSEKVWYNKKVLVSDVDNIAVADCLISVSYLLWLKEKFPYSHISYNYHNLVGKAKNLYPDQVPEGIELTTYDLGDSKKFGMRLTSGGEFARCNIRERLPIEYDVFYVGKDKGRGEYILELSKTFKKMGLRTKIIITPDTRLSKWKKYYSRTIPYSKVLEFDCKSKAILNIILPGQIAPTVRDFEALFLKSKLITNNINIKKCDFYKKENIFILGEDDMDSLPEFIEAPFVEVAPEILEKHLR